jgi:hypothetical protein
MRSNLFVVFIVLIVVFTMVVFTTLLFDLLAFFEFNVTLATGFALKGGGVR